MFLKQNDNERHMKKGIVLLFLSLILLMGLVLAIPSLPHTFVGEAKYKNTATVLTGQNISASIGSYGLGIVGKVGAENKYEVSVDPQGRTGTINFYIGGVKATETATYIFGGYTNPFKLTIQELPVSTACGNGEREPGEQCDGTQMGIGTCENVLGILGATGSLSCTSYCTFDYSNCSAPECGDSICNNGETCSSCPGDCGACPAPATTSSEGGSGGSSRGHGGGGFVPKRITNTSVNDTNSNLNESNVNSGVDTNGLNENKETTKGFLGLTGLSINGISSFIKTPAGKGISILVLVVIVLGIFFAFKFKNKKSSKLKSIKVTKLGDMKKK
jgi:hypothetical protein